MLHQSHRILNLFDLSSMKPQSLMDRIALTFAKRLERMRARDPDDDLTMQDEINTQTPIHSIDDPWRKMHEDMDRNHQAVKAWEAYYNEALVGPGIDSLGDHATAADNEGRVFRLTLDLADDEQDPVREVFEQIEQRAKRLKLEAMSPQILKRAFNEGDAYREVVVNVLRDTIVKLDEVPGAREGYLMTKLLDPGTRQHVGWALHNVRHGRVTKVYAPWQIVQFSWNQFDHYGTPLVISARKDIERAAEKDTSMHLARQERAYVKYAHIYDGVVAEELEKIKKKAESQKKVQGRGVQTDFYVNKDMKMFDPSNSQLQHLDDVEHTDNKILTAVRYPKGFHGGFGKNINRAILDKQEENLVRMLSKANAMLSEGYRQVLETQMILWGVLPDDVPFSFTWTDKNVEDFPETVAALAVAVQQIGLDPISALEELGWDPEIVMQRLMDWRNFENEMPRTEEEEFASRLEREMLALKNERPEPKEGDEKEEGDEEMESATDKLLDILESRHKQKYAASPGNGSGDNQNGRRSLRKGGRNVRSRRRNLVSFRF